jgi:hypothetical protein
MNSKETFENFLTAIKQKRIIIVKFYTKKQEMKERKCIPYDYAPSNIAQDKSMRYHFQDLSSPDGPHPLMKLPNEIISIELTDDFFDTNKYKKWANNWHIKRDW